MAQNLPEDLIRPTLQSGSKKTWRTEKVGNSLFSGLYAINRIPSKILVFASLIEILDYGYIWHLIILTLPTPKPIYPPEMWWNIFF